MVLITTAFIVYSIYLHVQEKKQSNANLPALEGPDPTLAITDGETESPSPPSRPRKAVFESVQKLMQHVRDKEKAKGGAVTEALPKKRRGGRNGRPPRAAAVAPIGWTSVECTETNGIADPPPIGAVVTENVAWLPYCKESNWWHSPFREYKQRSIKYATQNYAAKIGTGGFASVYHGMLPTGMQVAVKVTAERPNSNAQPDNHFSRWLSELKLAKQCEHRHVLRVLGYSYQKKKISSRSIPNPLRRKGPKLRSPKGELLEEPASPFMGMQVLEFMENGDLSAVLESKDCALDWCKRLEVLEGAAAGLAYIHSQGIVHRDIKPANIFLDHDFCPKIGDFGISKALAYVPGSPTPSITVSDILSSSSSSSEADTAGDCSGPSFDHTSARGTVGYLDPDYLATGVLTFKSDVFSFGVTILNVISGKKAYELVEFEDGSHAQSFLLESRVAEIIDPRLGMISELPVAQVVDITRIASLCMQRSPAARPTMEQVITLLCEAKDAEATRSSELLQSLWGEYLRSKHDFLEDLNSLLDLQSKLFEQSKLFDVAQASFETEQGDTAQASFETEQVDTVQASFETEQVDTVQASFETEQVDTAQASFETDYFDIAHQASLQTEALA